jgi:hypothetical protein
MKKQNKPVVTYNGFVVKCHQVGVYSAKKEGTTINGRTKQEIHDKIDALSLTEYAGPY